MPADTLPNWPAMSIAQANEMLAGPGSPLELEDAVINGVEMKVYKNAPPTIPSVLALAEAQFPDRDYIVYEDERVTFKAMAKAVRALAAVMRDTYGVQKGDRIAVVMRNYPQWPVAFYAALSLGAIATPMNSWWTGEELEYGLSFAEVRLAVVDPQIFERVRGHWDTLPNLEHMIIARDFDEEHNDPRISSLEDYIGDANSWQDLPEGSWPEIDLGPEDSATIMYTSGTTGKPKGALATHRAVISNMFNSMTCQARMFLRKGEAPPQPDPADRRATLLAIPFFHATGSFAILLPSALRGDKIVSMYKWDADKALPIIEKEKVSAVGGVPTIAWQILEHPDRDKYDLSSIQAISYGGAPSAPELVSTIKKRFPEAAPGNGWGMTETCATATLNIGEDYVNRPSSAGAPPKAVVLKICDPDGNEVPSGEVGELWCKGPMNCKKYWNRPDATAETFRDGWVVTGDLARLDEEGFLYLVDRAKDMLIRGGENVYCIEVENALYEHPAIMDAAVVGIPHKVLGEEVGAVVQLKPGMSVTEEELRHHAAKHLAAFKVPVEIHFMDEPLPRNANGKILKPVLREQFKPRG
ncbi:class I adenylate-forming enzyme family protein [Hyphomonas pacifica]|uniref:class I adenylate-forming enzyme family protein n=1 Tax=Hyphomonas pacifica TaxID=1280941 RepID=UPI000DBF965D|nr:class I adenylate-forming enzyme family protein [Hyphomonas pacifica]RAN35910.1 fatty acid--CoA ligase [Hyphomonas pacifica]